MTIEIKLDGRHIMDGVTAPFELAQHRPSVIKEIKEEKMDEYPKVTIERVKSRRLVLIRMEVRKDVFLTAGDKEETRAVGQEMPLFTSIPEEYFLPIMRAARSDPAFFDLVRDNFR